MGSWITKPAILLYVVAIIIGEVLSFLAALPGMLICRVFRPWRSVNKWWANINGFFWVPCPICGTWFGGHEITDASLETDGPAPVDVPVFINGVQSFSVPGKMFRSKCVCWKCEGEAEVRNRARRAWIGGKGAS